MPQIPNVNPPSEHTGYLALFAGHGEGVPDRR
jgi:hypothetical protein